MIPLVLLALVGVATGLGAVALRLHAGAVFPFAPAPHTSADTLVDHADPETIFARDGWQSVTLNRLRDVEDLLDSLEAHHVADREVCALGESGFRVRWR